MQISKKVYYAVKYRLKANKDDYGRATGSQFGEVYTTNVFISMIKNMELMYEIKKEEPKTLYKINSLVIGNAIKYWNLVS